MNTFRFQTIVPLDELQKFVEGVTSVTIFQSGTQLDVTLRNDKDLPDLTEYMRENNFEFVMKV